MSRTEVHEHEQGYAWMGRCGLRNGDSGGNVEHAQQKHELERLRA